jgi:hypothetical protein
VQHGGQPAGRRAVARLCCSAVVARWRELMTCRSGDAAIADLAHRLEQFDDTSASSAPGTGARLNTAGAAKLAVGPREDLE